MAGYVCSKVTASGISKLVRWIFFLLKACAKKDEEPVHIILIEQYGCLPTVECIQKQTFLVLVQITGKHIYWLKKY